MEQAERRRALEGAALFSHDRRSRARFLLVVRDGELNDLQKNIVAKSYFLRPCEGFNLYELPFIALAAFSDSLYAQTSKQLAETQTFPVDGFLSISNQKNFAYKSFDEKTSSVSYRGKGANEGRIIDYNRIFEDTIPNAYAGQDLIASFWMGNFNKDLYPRTTLEIYYLDSASNQPYGGYWANPAAFLKTLDGPWALLEVPLKLNHGHDKVVITLWHQEIYDESKLLLDELLIRPATCDLYRVFKDEIEKNNRYYKKP